MDKSRSIRAGKDHRMSAGAAIDERQDAFAADLDDAGLFRTLDREGHEEIVHCADRGLVCGRSSPSIPPPSALRSLQGASWPFGAIDHRRDGGDSRHADET